MKETKPIKLTTLRCGQIVSHPKRPWILWTGLFAEHIAREWQADLSHQNPLHPFLHIEIQQMLQSKNIVSLKIGKSKNKWSSFFKHPKYPDKIVVIFWELCQNNFALIITCYLKPSQSTDEKASVGRTSS